MAGGSDVDGQKRSGRDLVIEAASDLIAEATLDDVVAFLGPRSVARKARVAVGTVTYHFPTGGVHLGEAALARAAGRVGDDQLNLLSRSMRAVASDEEASEETAVDDFLTALARNLMVNSPAEPGSDPPVESREAAMYLAAAVAPRDARARRAMRDNLESNRLIREEIADSMLSHRRRRWRPGVDKETLALAQEALIYGFLLIRRFDPDRGDPQVYAAMAMRLFDACTVPESVPDTPDYRDSLLITDKIIRLDGPKLEAIVEAATEVYREFGWNGLNPVAVAERAGLFRPTVLANFKDRNSLAAPVWARFLPDLDQAAQRDLPLPVSAAAHASLQRVATIAHRDRALTAALIGELMCRAAQREAASPDDVADPRNIAPLDRVLGPAIRKSSHLFRGRLADSEDGVATIANSLTFQALHLAITQPRLASAEVADAVCDSTLAGLMKRRSSKSGAS
jgi:AcrR family transcriptional regulator